MAPSTLSSIVAGERRAGTEVGLDRNPADPREVVAEVALADAAVAGAAVDAAAAAFAGWSELPGPARGEILHKAGDLIDARAEAIARDLCREEGKTIGEALGETRRAAAIVRYFGAQTMQPDGETYPSGSKRTFLYARREAVGPVLVLTPWNFPIAIPAWKIAPALAYGNTVVWKPAELVPLTAHHLVTALLDAGLPPGALGVVLGKSAQVGAPLLADRRFRAVSFTGSNDVGEQVRERAMRSGARVQCEMGGKNPAIVLADADLPFAADQVARGAFMSAGQKCTATSRVFVDRSVYEDFRDLLAGIGRTWKVGDPLLPDTVVGPLASDAQLARVTSALEGAQRDGGRLVTGGALASGLPGYYVSPTVVEGLPPSARLSSEEVFGPVATLHPVGSVDEAIEGANDTPYGLAATIFTRDLGAALRFAKRIRAGVVKVNQETAGLELHVPFGGMKGSSYGPREQGTAAREFFTEWKTVYLDEPS